MQIERLAVALRPRGPWEAIDLGLRMARVWWRPLTAAWLAVTLPVALLLAAAAPGHPWLALLALWWLKPVFERVVLFVLSRGVFGDLPSWRSAVRALPGELRRGALLSLTLGRPTRARSFILPVIQLEGLRGRALAQRKQVLRRDVLGVAWLFQSTCALLEVSVVLSLYGLALLLVPGLELESIWEGLGNDWVTAYDWFHYALVVVAFAAIAPFYVAGGFALYLNRRMQLEGWDIELTFRKLAKRVADARKGPPAPPRARAAAALVLALWTAGATAPAEANDLLPASEARRVIDEIVQSESTTEWVFRDFDRSARGEIPGVGPWLASALRLIAIGAALFGLVYFLSKLEFQRLGSKRGREENAVPESVAGLDIRPESLPRDVVEAAMQRWAAGDRRGALSLLYRGALALLVGRNGLRVPESATEGECVRAVRRGREGSLVDDFAALTGAWQRVAYAHEPPPEAAFTDLCRRWRAHLRPSGAAPEARP